MAGILITIGDNIQKDHDKCLDFIIRNKGLHSVHEENPDRVRISKFSRVKDEGANHYIEGGACIWVIGTLIYKEFIGNKAISLLKNDLRDKDLESLVDQCDGPFCMVIKYPDENALRIITDHAGIMNIYKYRSGSAFALSSSSMALSRTYPVTPNKKAIAQFLRGASIYGNQTIYNEIELLDPATIYHYKIDPDGVKESKKKYWQSPVEVHEDISFEEARDTLIHHLIRNVEILSKEDLICDFTAGFDSRLIISTLSMFRPLKDIQTFVFGPQCSREVELVKGYCRSLGFGFNHLALPEDWGERINEYVRKSLYITDGEENIFTYAPILWAQEYKSDNHRYSVNGLGGEIYRDFWWIQEVLSSKRPANLDRLINTRVLQYEYDYSVFSDEFRPRMAHIKDSLKEVFLKSISDMSLRDSYNTLQIDNLYFRQKVRRWAGRTISSSNQIINALTPLTMKRCVESVMTIPPRYKRNGRLVKSIIEKLSWPLSGQKMLNGTPCRNMTLLNAHEFMPLAFDYGKRGMRKLVQKTMGRTILLDKTIQYQPSAFFASLFSRNGLADEFRYDSLVAKSLYDQDKYTRFIEEARADAFPYYNQIGNMLTLEMRMRNDNIRINT